MEKTKKRVLSNQDLMMIISTALLLAGIVSATLKLAEGFHIHYVCQMIMYCLTGFYLFFAYKIPHGNLLRYVMLLFAVSLIFEIKNFYDPFSAAVTELIMILIAYIAGRLHKIEQNFFIAIVILAGFLAVAVRMVFVTPSVTYAMCYSHFSGFVIWLSIGWAYLYRYNDHKEAGK